MAINTFQRDSLKQSSLDVLLKNRRVTDGFQYTVPSPSTYPYQWLWDSCFHAIVLSHFDLEDAKREIRSALAHQFDNGMIPHMTYWVPGELINIAWGKTRTSSITQPPLLAEAVWSIYEKDADLSFLKEVYGPMRSFYEYLLIARDPRGNHLAGIINPDESGEDNSPRFDAVLGLPPIQTLEENFKSRLKLVEELRAADFDAPTMKAHFWVKDVPFNAFLSRDLRILSGIAHVLDIPSDVERYANESSLIRQAMRERMRDDDGLFWPTYSESYTKIRLKTWAIFAPLLAHVLTSEEAHHLVEEHLMNEKEFATPFMVPTVSMDEPSFDSKGFWRGPTWIGVNWMLYCALRDYTIDDVAERILTSSVELLETFGFREYFDPLSGEGLGAHDFTWGSLIVDMLEYEPKPVQP